MSERWTTVHKKSITKWCSVTCYHPMNAQVLYMKGSVAQTSRALYGNYVFCGVIRHMH